MRGAEKINEIYPDLVWHDMCSLCWASEALYDAEAKQRDLKIRDRNLRGNHKKKKVIDNQTRANRVRAANKSLQVFEGLHQE